MKLSKKTQSDFLISNFIKYEIEHFMTSKNYFLILPSI